MLDHICTVFPYVKRGVNKICDSCYLAKQSRLPFPFSTSSTAFPFELVHIDIWGPLAVPSLQGHKYFLTIVDDFTRHTWIFLMRLKSEAIRLLSDFVTYVQTQFHTVIKIIRLDNGSEFNVPDFYAKFGIVHQTSCVETPQQNSIVERKHRHILNVTRCLLFHSHLPKCF